MIQGSRYPGEWRDHVVDPKGRKIGVLEVIDADTTTDEPAVATVRTGLPTRQRLVFVPLDEAILGPDYLEVSYAKSLVKSNFFDRHGRHPARRSGEGDLPALRHDLPQPGVKGERQLARR